jgi:hypothetical protein
MWKVSSWRTVGVLVHSACRESRRRVCGCCLIVRYGIVGTGTLRRAGLVSSFDLYEMYRGPYHSFTLCIQHRPTLADCASRDLTAISIIAESGVPLSGTWNESEGKSYKIDYQLTTAVQVTSHMVVFAFQLQTCRSPSPPFFPRGNLLIPISSFGLHIRPA